MSEPVYLGIDIGTSGVRGSCIDRDTNEIASHRLDLEPPIIDGHSIRQDPRPWRQAVRELILALSKQVGIGRIAAIAVDGTSGTVLLCDDHGEPLAPALMYNDQSCTLEALGIAQYAPADSPAQGASASLARALHLLKAPRPQSAHLCHQADWISGWLLGRYNVSDENNSLKLGYDAVERRWPAWLEDAGIDPGLLPEVHVPGTVIGRLDRRLSFSLGVNLECAVIAGTTDSIAAFIATGAGERGDAVTSLGSTLVLKIISDTPVFAPRYGIYSHRLGDHWLAGGASNSGCRILAELFSQNRIDALTAELKPDEPTGLDYYPLPAVGERFPVNDPEMEPRLEPRPANERVFFQAILEGITAIELAGYTRLRELGAPWPAKIYTTGGGSRNVPWAIMREHVLGVPIAHARHSEASYGAALLALKGAEGHEKKA